MSHPLQTFVATVSSLLTGPARAPAMPGGGWQSTEPWLQLGNRTVVWMVGGLLVLSAFTSLSGAVIATGKVVVESRYQAVQHPDGGVVRAILAGNGARVERGAALIELDPTEAQANLGVVRARLSEYRVHLARLAAERTGAAQFTATADIDTGDPEVAKIFAAQHALFQARRSAHLGEVAMLSERAEQASRDLTGLRALLVSAQSQFEITARELETLRPLFQKGFVNQQRVSPLEREAARLLGEIGRLEAEQAKLTSARAEAELALAQSRKQLLREVTDEEAKVQAQVAEQREAERKFADVLDRIVIRAPVTGRVHALSVHTVGGVITPASEIAQIIPEGAHLSVEARIAPNEIDRVSPGQPARVRFPAFNARATPDLAGTMTRLSPAEAVDEQGRSYYTAEVDIPEAELASLGAGHRLVPGMPAEVLIETEARSILSYLAKPLVDAMGLAFRER
ncbi:MAG: HlyD family type I secretion periplasmic adaptor subunit [Hyphomicrobiaceae bacterium]|nr:HlyD family type I secretion periplasmic adaptor subunit [Hyphomicrobiaceae bacterium]